MALTLPTGPRGQALALGMTVVVAAFVWIGAIDPVMQWYYERAELLRHDVAMANRMNDLVQILPDLRREAEDMGHNGGRDSDASAVLLEGATDALAAAALEQKIDELAASSGVRIGSEEMLPGKPVGELTSITVRLAVSAPYHSLAGLLLALARSHAPMIVEELRIRGTASASTAADVPVEVEMTVTSYRATKAEPR
jgi:general secretion pathway protein M